MSAKMNVPELRFGEFSGEWERIKIQKLIDNKLIISHLDGNHGELYPKSSEFTTNGVPYISANDLENGKVNFNHCKYLPKARAKQFKKGMAYNGDVLFAHNATVGPTALLETDLDYVILSTTTTYFRCDNNKLLNKFLFLYFSTEFFIKQYSRVMYQSTRNQVPITAQRLFYINLPSKPEQEKIASFLSSVDSKIEQLSKKKTLLEQYKKGVMQKIFSQELRFKEDDGSAFPEWVERKLGDTLEVVVDNRGKTPPTTDFGIPLIEVNAIGNKEINYLKVSKYVTENTYKTWFRKYLKDGDILFSTVGQTAICSIYDESIKAVIAQNIIGLRFVNEFNLFMYYLLTEIKNHYKFKRIEMGAVQPSIKVSQMIHINFYIPSLKEQTKIANFLSSLDKKIELTDKKLNATKEFKKGLLQKMFV